MQKRKMLILLWLALWAGGCATTSPSAPGASTATAASSQPSTQAATTQAGDSQDRDARIKESDAVRKSMGY
jgi:hypothetical protein